MCEELNRVKSLWSNLKGRCKENGGIQNNNQTYIGCENNFSNFQSFYSWVISQPTAFYKDSKGKYWELDKDICFDGNTSYSPDTCVFLPHRLNTILSSSGKIRGLLPQGVTFDTFTGRYAAQIRMGGKQYKIGRFDNPEVAHKAWQREKLNLISEEISKVALCERALSFFLVRMDKLKFEIDNNLISEWGL